MVDDSTGVGPGQYALRPVTRATAAWQPFGVSINFGMEHAARCSLVCDPCHGSGGYGYPGRGEGGQ